MAGVLSHTPPRRVKLIFILLVLVASTLALLAWTQVWVNAVVAETGVDALTLAVDGSDAAPAVTALALAGFALGGALTIAGRSIRVVLGVLEILLAVSVFLSAYLVLGNPALASAPAVTAATGIAGTESILAAVASASVTPWPYVALAASVIMFVTGAGIIATASRWPGPTTRYQTTRLVPAAGSPTGGSEPDAVVDWDDLSRGEDPTA
ncbi:Trp biosynthesis-associated membrane protein [Cryobacterium psychrophilum]|uniref:Peptidase n=1 Tax=Cryobacterium psychrophilum TaxID=41988 RepID=A0A4Y8KTY9_9MICO|nr:Trp biosynthesis-associated membrane protein [Cryobacterium psychrophilum]TDW28606.1 tryptophan-associated transmembrane protein [Cryobacterium psychrophilum]TFD80398.1 peptidase [Cryobacterium psychrophilum]